MSSTTSSPFEGYASPSYDELIVQGDSARGPARRLADLLRTLGPERLRARQAAAVADIRRLGITFTVYDFSGNIDREWPFDIIPRVLGADEWLRIERGLMQRLRALNAFISDVYNEQRVVKAGVLPAELLRTSRYFLESCRGIRPKYGVWAHISGSDLVRDKDGEVYVLEDNLRIPSGVSYMLENRAVTKRVFPELFSDQSIHPVNGYVSRLHDLLCSLAPDGVDDPTIVLLTPGVHNSAYFEHCYLAQEMGVELVEGRDLFVENDRLYARTIAGPERVHVVYRRVDDAFLDPAAFRSDSTLGVRGLLGAFRAGNVALVNAPGAGVADDKVVYSYVPDLVRYYLGEDPILPNVPTFRLVDERERAHVFSKLEDFVVKPANESGGYGVVIGDQASHADLERCREAVLADPRNFIAQPIVRLSTAPTLCGDSLRPRHLDLRPFVLSGLEQYVTRGGLTRVALREGSLVVNSSQGGGSKDTWIVASN